MVTTGVSLKISFDGKLVEHRASWNRSRTHCSLISQFRGAGPQELLYFVFPEAWPMRDSNRGFSDFRVLEARLTAVNLLACVCAIIDGPGQCIPEYIFSHPVG